jgi:hypothetical protein
LVLRFPSAAVWPAIAARSARVLSSEPGPRPAPSRRYSSPFGVGDQRERQFGLVLGQFRGGGVEDDDLPDAVGADLVMAGDDRAEVTVADGASGEAPELKVDEVARGVRDRDQLAGGRGEFQRWEGIARSCGVAGARVACISSPVVVGTTWTFWRVS